MNINEQFETALQGELNKLPYTKHLDDGQYNDGRQAGFEEGARWVNIELAALRKENEELREFVWRVNTICSTIAMPTEKQVDEMRDKSKNLLKP